MDFFSGVSIVFSAISNIARINAEYTEFWAGVRAGVRWMGGAYARLLPRRRVQPGPAQRSPLSLPETGLVPPAKHTAETPHFEPFLAYP